MQVSNGSGPIALCQAAAHPIGALPDRRELEGWVGCGQAHWRPDPPEIIVLYTIAVVFLVLWLLGVATSFTAGGLLHLLLVVALVALVYQLITGRAA